MTAATGSVRVSDRPAEHRLVPPGSPRRRGCTPSRDSVVKIEGQLDVIAAARDPIAARSARGTQG
jgi:hypothetical protein